MDRQAVTPTGSVGVHTAMRIYTSVMLLIALAIMLPGGCLLLPLAYARYRRAGDRP